MRTVFAALPWRMFFTIEGREGVFRKIGHRYAWVYRTHYRGVPVYEPVVGRPDDIYLAPDQPVVGCEEPRTGYVHRAVRP